MSLKFRDDPDLHVLSMAKHDDLVKLSRVLTHDANDDEPRRSQQLLDDEVYKAAVKNEDLRGAWKSIAAELQAYGGDSIANAWRTLLKDHTGVTYREILTDICEHLKLKISPAKRIKSLEDQLLIGLILSQKENLEQEQLSRIMREAAKGENLGNVFGDDWSLDDLIAQITSDARISYLTSLVVPAMASAALPFLARLSAPALLMAIAPRAGGALVPGLNVVAVASALTLLTSPAFRVTLPAVLEVIRIRRLALLSASSAEDQQ